MTKDEHSVEVRASKIAEHGQEILEARYQIENYLQSREEDGKVPDQDVFLREIAETLASVTTADSLDDISFPLLNYIKNYPGEELQELQSHDPDPELLKFLTDLVIDYQDLVRSVRTNWNQGPNFWKKLETDFIRWGYSGNPGLNHHIRIEGQGEVELSMNMKGQIQFLNYQINRLHTAQQQFDSEDVENQMDIESLNSIKENIDELIESIEEEA